MAEEPPRHQHVCALILFYFVLYALCIFLNLNCTVFTLMKAVILLPKHQYLYNKISVSEFWDTFYST